MSTGGGVDAYLRHLDWIVYAAAGLCLGILAHDLWRTRTATAGGTVSDDTEGKP